ncbi:MAG: M1 family metallopeptidase [Lentisphaerae bacterium]|nr:M1 family metallopeptidase [Lentisphaerota bacterium]
MDISLQFVGEEVHGCNTLRMRAGKDLRSLQLDARDLDIHSVEWLGGEGDNPAPLKYEYRRTDAKLVLTFPGPVSRDECFTVRTSATCRPSDHILEGIYRDTTPDGCPQQYISQCQQWGFQRILPVIDDCTAKCTMTTTLEADAGYTHLISNGDVCRDGNPAGVPLLKPEDRSRKVITYRNTIPMAPYLFVVCVGTWDVLEDEIVYPSGRRVKLEYLVPPGRLKGAEIPMSILKESILWQGRTQEYEYAREVYRTICMEKSNFGGMENVGNTTIITSAALVDEDTDDRRLEYAHGVIVHEFEHNECGSDVTMETPFDMWLNEAFTVDVERRFLMSQFDADVERLDEVASMRAPVGGPLAVEDAGHLGNIVREGFNDPDELVDGVTYVKAAEVIRMLRLVLGPALFREAVKRYFSRHEGGNANTDDFFACFEEVSGKDLSQFRKEWLYTIGYPCIEVTREYDEAQRRLALRFTQARTGDGGFFHVPVDIAAVDADGEDIPAATRTVEITGDRLDVVVDGVPRPAFLSLNRNCSFYGTFLDRGATRGELLKQVRQDPNLFNRVEAMRQITDGERVKLLTDPAAEPSPDWLDVYGGVLGDRSLPPGLKAYLLGIEEQSLRREYLPWYRERYRARIRMLEIVAGSFFDALVDEFEHVDTYGRGKEPRDGVEERRLKAVLLRVLVQADTPEAHRIAEEHYGAAWNLSDRLSALSCINLSSHPRRREIVASAYDQWKDRLVPYTNYLHVVGAGTHEDVFDMIAEEEVKDTFKQTHPGHVRALYLPMSANNKMLWTDRGIDWLAETAISVAPINENTAVRLVGAFRQVARLADDLRPRVVAALERMRDGIDDTVAPSVSGRIRAYLKGLS